jgi:hypothetical protein
MLEYLIEKDRSIFQKHLFFLIWYAYIGSTKRYKNIEKSLFRAEKVKI